MKYALGFNAGNKCENSFKNIKNEANAIEINQRFRFLRAVKTAEIKNRAYVFNEIKRRKRKVPTALGSSALVRFCF